MVHLYKVPDFYMAGFFGSFGSGKSLALLEHGIDLANFYKCRLAANIRLRPNMIKLYCRLYGFDWFRKFGRVLYCPDINDLFKLERCILLFDEVGSSDLFSRNFKSNSMHEVLRDKTFRCRHYKNKILFAAQRTGQVDKQLRDNCQLFVWCRGFSLDYKMYSRSQFFLNRIAFDDFEERYQNKFIYPIWKSGFRWVTRLVGKKEGILFSCYDSFDRPYANDYISKGVVVVNDPCVEDYQVMGDNFGVFHSEVDFADKLDCGVDLSDLDFGYFSGRVVKRFKRKSNRSLNEW